MISISSSDKRFCFLPWRSAAVGWTVAALALLAGVPLFLCMPPWNDVTLHDMAARAMLRGGVHYRDVFDTNLPGIDWAMAGIRSVLGRSYEAMRAVDLLVIALEVVLLLGWVRRCGGASYTVAWLAASAALFYPFTSEFNHIQRDPWLLLPALTAARLRLSRTLNSILNSTGQAGIAEISLPSSIENESPFWRSGVEGVLWGVAVWVKPHVIIPAFALWLASVIIIARRETGQRIRRDLLGLMTGGLLAGSAGVAWLVGTGAWPYFLDVFLNWNPSYLDDMWGSALARFIRTFYCFRPWGILHYAAIALAVLALWEVRIWSHQSGQPRRVWGTPWLYAAAGSESVAIARAFLAAFYLGWLAQGIFLQKGFDYVQIPLLLLAMAMVATHRWAFGFAYLIWFATLAAILNCPALAPVARTIEPWLPEVRAIQDPLTDLHIMKYWSRCWREGGSAELRDKLGHFTDIHCGTNWEDLEGVAKYLKTLNPPLGPGELNCWHDSTHPLYLMLDLDPATRYMHYGTAFGIRKQAGIIAEEVAGSRQKYVVSDLLRMTWSYQEAYAPGANGDPHQLPRWFPASQRAVFPWNQPIVFRSGRYVVHKVEKPLGLIDVPDWNSLDSLGPGEK
jgi:hypothetical protein